MNQYLMEVHKKHSDQREGEWTTKEILPMAARDDAEALREATLALDGHKLKYKHSGHLVLQRSTGAAFTPWLQIGPA